MTPIIATTDITNSFIASIIPMMPCSDEPNHHDMPDIFARRSRTFHFPHHIIKIKCPNK